LTEKTRFKLLRFGERLNMIMFGIDLASMAVSLFSEVSIPHSLFLLASLHAASWFLCADGIERMRAYYNLDDSGNPKIKKGDDDETNRR
jgi:hypothetical protein